jgi:hypothetical protein
VSALVHHVGLAVAVCALGGAGLRVASAAAPHGLARAVAAVVVAAAAAVAEALLLGLVGLGGSPVALVVAALATWVAARTWLPAPGLSAWDELRAWARGLDRWSAAGAGAVAGLVGAWTAWLYLHPALGHDMVLYHLPEAIQWVHSGHPGAIEPIISSVPVGNYPVTHEVLLEWGLGIGRSFVWATLVTALAPVLAGAAGWLGLRALGVDRLVRGLAVAALVAVSAVVASQLGGASLDPAALAWLLSCAALCACSRERPALLAPAVAAAGLAIGTKTTAAPLSLLVLAVGAWPVRGALRPLVRPLVAAVALAFGVGGVWYLRNTVQHGWPLWPFSAAPWGDPRPPIIANADVKFIDRPGATIDRLGDYYLHHFGGPLLLFCGALAAAVAARSRTVLFVALAALGSLFIWMNAPFTGVFGATRAFDIGTGDATRYLLPGAAGGAVLVWLVPRLRTPRRGVSAALAGAVAVLGVGALAAVAATGFVERHGRTGTRESPLAAWFAAQPAWRDGSAPIASTWSLVGTLAGDRLQHPLVLVDAEEACRRGAAAGWLVVDRNEARLRGAPGCAAPPGYSDRDYEAYGPGQLRGAVASTLPAP